MNSAAWVVQGVLARFLLSTSFFWPSRYSLPSRGGMSSRDKGGALSYEKHEL